MSVVERSRQTRASPVEIEAFLLSREWRDTPSGVEITLWCASSSHGPIKAIAAGQRAVMFVPRHVATETGRREPKQLRTREGAWVDAVYFDSQRALIAERDRLRDRLEHVLESDVKPSDRFLMERFVRAPLVLRGLLQPGRGYARMIEPQIRPGEHRAALEVLALDIETDGWDGPLLSIALAGEGLERVCVVRDGRDHGAITFHATERSALLAAFDVVRSFDPDVLVGWNVVEFDLTALERRCAANEIPFAIGRGGERARVLPGSGAQQVSVARVPGRVVLDGIATLKNAAWPFERFTLDHVAKKLVGRGKAIAADAGDALAEIRRMFHDDPDALAHYNLEDCRLVREIFAAADLLGFAVERAALTGLPLDRQGGAVAAFDHLYLPRLHRRGYVAPDVGVDVEAMPSPGGYVLDSVPGIYRNVLSFDFRSLYPSIIRTFHIDPLALWSPGEDPVPGFDGATFSRDEAILADIVAELASARATAQKAGSDALSRAIKVLMASLYGVLGAPGCRFFDPRLASSITRRGHEIIGRTRELFEQRGFRVIYGDTDSLFVAVDPTLDEASCRAIGSSSAAGANAFWRDVLRRELRLESFLELRFDLHFLRYLMPTTRGAERGSKKRYAGTVRAKDGSTELVIRGLEAVRTDWTPLARSAQRELLRLVFDDAPWEQWLRELRADLLAGKLDVELTYRRKLRRDLRAYDSSPPHVKAARLMLDADDETGAPNATEVEYVMTARGAEPTNMRSAPIDYRHYLEKQLAPALDVVLPLLGTTFDRVTGPQLELF